MLEEEEGKIGVRFCAAPPAVMRAAVMVRLEQHGQEASWDTLMGFQGGFLHRGPRQMAFVNKGK